jgi:hypothetical protein
VPVISENFFFKIITLTPVANPAKLNLTTQQITHSDIKDNRIFTTLKSILAYNNGSFVVVNTAIVGLAPCLRN